MAHDENAALDSAIRHALDGSAILFVGAGVSYLSTNALERPLPNGLKLSHQLHEALGVNDRQHTLERISGHFVRTLGAPKLFDFLKDRLDAKKVDERLAALYRLNWRRIYTTNYDDAILVSRKGAYSPRPLSLEDKPEQVPPSAPIHLNGFIGSVTPYNIADHLTLTDVSYAASNFAGSPWSQFFRTDVRICRSIIFLGYSLFDLDIKKILLSDVSLRRKTVFVIGPDADEIEMGEFQAYGTVYAKGFEFLAERVRAISAEYSPPAKAEIFNALQEMSADSPESGSNAAVKIHEQLVYGAPPVVDILKGNCVFDSVSYLVEREQIKSVIEQLRIGGWRDVIISGDLASGKTFAAIQLARHYIGEGYRVFWVPDGRDVRRDLDALSTKNEKICVIVDGYRNSLDAIRAYASQRAGLHSIILTERSATHELLGDLVETMIDPARTLEIVLGSLGRAEIEQFDALINYSGLWGDIAGLPQARRVGHIENRLGASLYRVLLEIIQSRRVQTEIQALLNSLRADESTARFFITAFITNVLGYNFWINDWQKFYGIEKIRSVIRDHKYSIGHFIIEDSALIKPRSGILSAYLLRNFSNDVLVGECLVDMYQCATRNTFGDDEFGRIVFDLMKYSVIEPLFGDKQKLKLISNYYEKIRSIGHTRDNPDYWLQYGIATTIHGDLERAGTAFANAYQREKARARPNLTRIDNYYSRYEMQKAIQTDDSAEAFSLFKSGCDRLTKQIFLNNNRHYPFKTGRAFGEIAGRHYKHWSDQQKATFLKMCREIREKALSWERKNRAPQTDVSLLIRETAQILRTLEG